MRSRTLILATVALITSFEISCSNGAVREASEQRPEKNGPPSIEGLVTWITDRDPSFQRGEWKLQVEADTSDQIQRGTVSTPKAEVTVNPNTRLLKRDQDGQYHVITRSQIAVGNLARVWYVPGLPILDSYPEMAHAQVISFESGRSYRPPLRKK